MGRFVVFEFWSDGSFNISVEEGDTEEIEMLHEHNQNAVFLVDLAEFLKKLKEIDIIKHMHEEHIL